MIAKSFLSATIVRLGDETIGIARLNDQVNLQYYRAEDTAVRKNDDILQGIFNDRRVYPKFQQEALFYEL